MSRRSHRCGGISRRRRSSCGPRSTSRPRRSAHDASRTDGQCRFAHRIGRWAGTPSTGVRAAGALTPLRSEASNGPAAGFADPKNRPLHLPRRFRASTRETRTQEGVAFAVEPRRRPSRCAANRQESDLVLRGPDARAGEVVLDRGGEVGAVAVAAGLGGARARARRTGIGRTPAPRRQPLTAVDRAGVVPRGWGRTGALVQTSRVRAALAGLGERTRVTKRIALAGAVSRVSTPVASDPWPRVACSRVRGGTGRDRSRHRSMGTRRRGRESGSRAAGVHRARAAARHPRRA